MKTIVKGPYINPKLKLWEISWINSDGSCGGVWAETKEECLKEYEENK